MGLRNDFTINLKKFRKKKNLSQMQLAELCSTATSYIGEIEIGRKFPSITMVEKIAATLGIEPYQLFLHPEEKLPAELLQETRATLDALQPGIKKNLAGLIKAVVSTDIDTILVGE